MARPWFRMYSEAVDDDKLRLLAFEDRWHFVAILCLKGMGALDSDAPHLERRIALKLGLQLPQLDEVKRRLIEVRLIDENWQPTKWNDRQFESDVSTGRVKAFRRKAKRFRNVSETDQNRTEQNRTESMPDGLDLPAWERWVSYRRSIAKPLRGLSVAAAQKKLAAFGTDQLAVVDQSIANSWQGLFPLKDQPQKSKGAGSGLPTLNPH